MATMNPFDILDGVDNDDPSQLVAAARLKAEKPKKEPVPAQTQAQLPKQAKFPSKPAPPAEAVREARNEGGRGGGGRGGGRGFGRGRGRGRSSSGSDGFNGDSNNNETTFGRDNGFSGGYKPSEGGDAGKPYERRGYGATRGGFHGGCRGGFSNGEAGAGEQENPRRFYERLSGIGHGNEIKRNGAGIGNWGSPTEEIAPESEDPVVETDKNVSTEKQPGEEEAVDAKKDSPDNEPEEKESEDKEMTLEEYEKIREEKRKALLALKSEERKVEIDKELGSMLQLSSKKGNDEIFIKLGSEKDKRRDTAEKEDRSKKSMSINEFLKPAEGEWYPTPGGRGRGRGRGPKGGFGGGHVRGVAAPAIEDPGQFPSLASK